MIFAQPGVVSAQESFEHCFFRWPKWSKKFYIHLISRFFLALFWGQEKGDACSFLEHAGFVHVQKSQRESLWSAYLYYKHKMTLDTVSSISYRVTYFVQLSLHCVHSFVHLHYLDCVFCFVLFFHFFALLNSLSVNWTITRQRNFPPALSFRFISPVLSIVNIFCALLFRSCCLFFRPNRKTPHTSRVVQFNCRSGQTTIRLVRESESVHLERRETAQGQASAEPYATDDAIAPPAVSFHRWKRFPGGPDEPLSGQYESLRRAARWCSIGDSTVGCGPYVGERSPASKSGSAA